MATVIVFGPTGQIGSVVARTAAEHGAKVWLAMRDTQKTVPGLDADLDRVHADLDKPDTVQQAAQTSGATRAFVYLAHGSADNMRATFAALKAGGVASVVFLSSFTIYTDRALRDIPASEGIPYVHAQAEANLDDVFGADNYTALRPGAFVTNLMQHQKGIAAGKLDLYGGGFQQDNIVPADIGRVGGVVLASGAKNGQRKVYLYGPQVRSIHDSIVRIGQTLGKEIAIAPQDRQTAYENYLAFGLPEPMAKYMCEVLSSPGPIKTAQGERFPNYDEGVANVELYTGKASMGLEEWAKENKAALSG